MGRPRDSQVDHAIASATRELLAECGYGGITVAAVAARAGVGKAAIYRRHATKQEMIFAAAVHGMDESAPPDGGSLRADLAAVVDTVAGQLGGAAPDVLHGLLADIHGDSRLAARFADTFLDRHRAILTEVLDRAVDRGELDERPDPVTVQALLIGPVFYLLLVLGGGPERLPGLTAALVDSVADRLLDRTQQRARPRGRARC